jgi:heme exporter protein A
MGLANDLLHLASISSVDGGPAPGIACRTRPPPRRLALLHASSAHGDLTAEENLQFYGRLYSIGDLSRRVSEVLTMIGLEARRRDLVRTFSRGMQQRLAIGRAVLHDPDVMLFDEPHTGLDQDASAMLDGVLRSVAAQGRTVLMTSHDLARSEALATRFDILSRGVIVASGTKRDLGRSNLLSFYKRALAD